MYCTGGRQMATRVNYNPDWIQPDCDEDWGEGNCFHVSNIEILKKLAHNVTKFDKNILGARF